DLSQVQTVQAFVSHRKDDAKLGHGATEIGLYLRPCGLGTEPGENPQGGAIQAMLERTLSPTRIVWAIRVPYEEAKQSRRVLHAVPFYRRPDGERRADVGGDMHRSPN